MEFNEVQTELYRILQEADGRFRTPYQICIRIQEENPDLWALLLRAYPSVEGQPPMGAGSGTYYSPASFVSHALDYFFQNDLGDIIKAWFDSKNIIFENIEPGFKGGWISIWAWRPLFEESIR